MDLLIAYSQDPAGRNMAQYLSKNMTLRDGIYRSRYYDLIFIDSPAISADWLESKYSYDAYIFLSRHAAESGVLALTCHNTGNFATAKFGGNDRQVSIPYSSLQKIYLQTLYQNRELFPDFEITLEATHHGPTALEKPSIFIELGTTIKQWNDTLLCNSVANIIHQTLQLSRPKYPIAICFGGTHYPSKFTNEIIHGKYALGTIAPKHVLGDIDETMFNHILNQNPTATAALLDWRGLGPHKQQILNMLKDTNLNVILL